MVGWKPKSLDSNVASVRHRCLLPLAELQKQGFPVELFEPTHRDVYCGVIFSKSYGEADQELARRLRLHSKFVVLDLCDNHFYNPQRLPAYEQARKDLLSMIGLADLVVCSTSALAETVKSESGVQPVIVGDPVEFSAMPAPSAEERKTAPLPQSKRPPRLLWFGIHASPNAPCGMADICNVENVLRRIANEHCFELVVCSNSRADYDRLIKPIAGVQSSYVEYRKETFPALLAEMDGVILPVSQNPFTWAKSHNRLTTALFAGVPVVADKLPSYLEFSEFCAIGDWEAGLIEILCAPQEAQQKALRGREYLTKNWMPHHVAQRWHQVLSPLLGATFSPRILET